MIEPNRYNLTVRPKPIAPRGYGASSCDMHFFIQVFLLYKYIKVYFL